MNLRSILPLCAASTLLLLLACGGGGGGNSDGKSSSGTPTIVYTAPNSTGTAPIVQLNQAMSTSSLVVFDVIGNNPSQQIDGVVVNFLVDPTKLIPVAVPGTWDPEPRHLMATPTVMTGGFGNGTAIAVRKDRADGTSMMAVAIRRPSSSVACSGVLMRFAYQVVGTPVQGVIRTQVVDGSGITANGYLVSGTSPVVGRLEYK